MPFARSPVIARSDSSQKKQQSISSFFAPKPNAAPKSPLEPQPENTTSNEIGKLAQAANPDRDNPLFLNSDEEDAPRKSKSRKLKRSSEEATNIIENEELPPKRRKQMTDDGRTSEHDEEGHPLKISRPKDRKAPAQASSTELNGIQRPKLSERTSKYIFSSSPVAAGIGGDLDDDESRKVKESLHRKFVKKLGKPDSIADIKRRNHFINEETAEGEEDAQDEDAEDEEAAAKPATKSKKSSTLKKGGKKLTPMEQQIMDLKRKHMDTLLVVEVGYKFRFFGEDARVAAKELGIVCIPGKFRFDERKCSSGKRTIAVAKSVQILPKSILIASLLPPFLFIAYTSMSNAWSTLDIKLAWLDKQRRRP